MVRAARFTPAVALLAVLAGCGSGTSTTYRSGPPTATASVPASTPANAGSLTITASTKAAAAPSGSAMTKTTGSTAPAVAIATACGNLRARLAGVESQHGFRDPQPAALRGRNVARELVAADAQALAADHEIEAELRADGGAAAATAPALERAERDVSRVDAASRMNVRDSVRAGLHLQARFLRFAFSQLRAVCPRRG